MTASRWNMPFLFFFSDRKNLLMCGVMVTFISRVLYHPMFIPLPPGEDRVLLLHLPVRRLKLGVGSGSLEVCPLAGRVCSQPQVSEHTGGGNLFLRQNHSCCNRVPVICLSQDGNTCRHRMTAMRNTVYSHRSLHPEGTVSHMGARSESPSSQESEAGRGKCGQDPFWCFHGREQRRQGEQAENQLL